MKAVRFMRDKDMYYYEISKYGKESMNEHHLYTDWLAMSDIGRTFQGKVLTKEEYMRVETNYIRAIYLILNYHVLEELEVRNVRKSFSSYKKFLSLQKNFKELYTKEILSMYDEVPLLSKANLSEIGLICRLQLREDIGCRLFYPRRLKIFIGYDFIMGITSSRPLEPIIPQILDNG